jgi:hypothetical protein
VETADRAEAQTEVTTASAAVAYSPPKLTVVGSVYELTLFGGRDRCFFGKKYGGSDGLHVGPVLLPVSSC